MEIGFLLLKIQSDLYYETIQGILVNRGGLLTQVWLLKALVTSKADCIKCIAILCFHSEIPGKHLNQNL